jgi:hypothetical protein
MIYSEINKSIFMNILIFNLELISDEKVYDFIDFCGKINCTNI